MNSSPEDVVVQLVSGKSTVRFTVREGWTIDDIGRHLVAGGWLRNDTGWLQAARRPRRIAGQLIVTGAEGFCFPATYELVPDASPDSLVVMMTSEFERRWRRLYKLRLSSSPLSDVNAITIVASIVERETNVASERPVIAAIFLKRVKRGMRLQSCATVRYATHNWDQPLTRHDLQYPSGYNTYLTAGFPVGPICSPGEPSLVAALRPADTDFLYFVRRRTGGNAFSKTYAEHLRAKKREGATDALATEKENS